MILEKVSSPGDVKKLTREELEQLASEVRSFLIQSVSETGGHLASNLGVVELTIALFCVFNLPEDKIIWDVGHQSYTHKILSGRKNEFDTLRKFGGLSGFPKKKESDCDVFETGHSSTSISAGLGFCHARDLKKQHNYVVSVIGDGSLTGGMAYEAMNNAAQLKTNYIIVLNDNDMSISRNVGGMSRYLSGIRTAPEYASLKLGITNSLSKIPVVGKHLVDRLRRAKDGVKQMVIPGMLFENMGLTYLGPVDGHNIQELREILSDARLVNGPVIVHVKTRKGYGYQLAEKNPTRFHGVEPFDPVTGKSLCHTTKPSYTEIFSRIMCRLGEECPEMAAITAAMPVGTGLDAFGKKFPERFFDVGIAEQHAVTFAAALAANGLRPVVAIYSSFLQRAYDQISHDVCQQNLPVVFAIDRAGLVGSDGETHQGVFDISYMSHIPNMTIIAPKNGWELEQAMEFAIRHNGPVAVRYPRGTASMTMETYKTPIEYGKSEILVEESYVAILALGTMTETALEVHQALAEREIPSTVVNMRFAKPLDTQLLDRIREKHTTIVTVEENVYRGGIGEAIGAYLLEKGYKGSILNIAIPDQFVEHGTIDQLKHKLGIDVAGIMKRLSHIPEC